jgi:hypothetical protein
VIWSPPGQKKIKSYASISRELEKQCHRLCYDEEELAEFFCQLTSGHDGPHLALPSGRIER